MKILCYLKHDWIVHQDLFLTDKREGPLYPGKEVVIAWKQCKRCAKSKLIHILK